MREPDEPGLGERVDRDDAGAAPRALAQRGQHAGMVGARVLTDHQHQIGQVEVVDADGALANTDRLAEGDPARLVTQVRAVREVVGAEPAPDELVQKRRLVRGPARGVERGAGRASLAQRVGPQRDRVGPRDRPVVTIAGAQHHRLGDAAELAQLVLAERAQVVDRPLREPRRGREHGRGFLGDGLGAVLAKLEARPLARLGPGAAWAVKAGGLVEREQRLGGAGRAVVLDGDARGRDHRAEPARRRRRRAQLDRGQLGIFRFVHTPPYPRPAPA